MAFLKNSMPALVALGIVTGAAGVAGAADLEPVTAPVVAEPASHSDNFYVSLFGGVNLGITDSNFSNGAGLSVDTDFESGFLLGGALGYKWKNFSYAGITPRTELEVNYFRNGVDSLDFSGNGVGNETLAGDSNLSGVGVFGNLFFDWNNAFGTRLTPYAGGGVGVAFVNTDIVYNGGLNLNDNDTAFAFNAGAGASYELTKRASIFLDARYNRIVNVDSDHLNGITPAGGNFEDGFGTVQVRTGLSISF